ncbi:MAG: hypothetical protein QGH34_00130 [Candidatus Woesearchaeota archaeon]|jgi:hypothetical protein|nr:hypothetical protein [Candidatus Woesearchaeota archaeon]MDP6647787.1 hypothetical protein [Candidatus Woesearchaeota archaeon]|tara:strand:- start:45 stop:728 length:684 start_codon:yes stop_codon:yes gene_type:complete
MVDTLEVSVVKKPKDNYEQWMGNYSIVRAFTNFLFDKFKYEVNVEGELPKEGPRLLVLPHQNSLDAISLMRGIDEYLAFTYKVNEQAKLISMWVLPYIGGIKISNYVHVKKLFEHLDRNSLVVAFPQGVFENKQVSYVKSGVAKLVQIYEQRQKREVVIIPGGIEYQFPKNLPKRAPVPLFKFPFPGTTATLRFAAPRSLDGRNPKELTEIVMRESAKLSNLDYVVN